MTSNVFQGSHWLKDLSKGVVTFSQLEELGLIKKETLTLEQKTKIADLLQVRIPQSFLEKDSFNLSAIENLEISKQIIPSSAELDFLESELLDPIGDEKHSPAPNITHRYPDRALFKVTYQCAMYCRFCFRRYKVSHESNTSIWNNLEQSFAYLKSHKEIKEVILTGGDPLTLTDTKLETIFDSLDKIDHIETYRIHTRIPTALPNRIDTNFLKVINKINKPLWIVAHINSEKELTSNTTEALNRLTSAGVPVLAQSVLLKEVNDTTEQLMALFRSLIRIKVKPYYLHFPDQAKGTSHFRLSLEKAVSLMTSLRGNISGFAIPQLVVDIPGGLGKIIAGENWITDQGNGIYLYKSPITGESFTFVDPL